MNTFLVLLNFASVQSFLAAARRSRDLWYGSYLASELSKAMARALAEHGNTLIFPAPTNPQLDLLPAAPGGGLAVANKVLAVVRTKNDSPEEDWIKEAKKAAQTRWQDIAGVARIAGESLFPGGSSEIDPEIWDQQLNEPLEIFATWWPVAKEEDLEDPERYPKHIAQLEELLARRKLSRLFHPSPLSLEQSQHREKSSLDGRRESVLSPRLPGKVRRRWGLNEREALDAVGLVKRLGGRFDHEGTFTPLTRLAIDPWVSRLDNDTQNQLRGWLNNPTLNQERLVSRVTADLYQALPWDGQLLYPFRLDAALADLKAEADNNQNLIKALTELREQLQPVWKEFGNPPTAVAVLAADGDKMGERISGLKTLIEHQRFSQALSRFARTLPKEVEKTGRGQVIYAGGDDLLAVLPVPACLKCAQAVHDAFGHAFDDLDLPKPPTLSLGLALGHMLEPMGSLFDRARQALELAKGADHPRLPEEKGRNTLAISLKPRSGGEIVWRGKFDQDQNPPIQRLEDWRQAFRDSRLSRQTPYRLRELITLLRGLKGSLEGGDSLRKLFELQLARAEVDPEIRQKLVKQVEDIESNSYQQNQALDQLTAELLIGRWLAGKE